MAKPKRPAPETFLSLGDFGGIPGSCMVYDHPRRRGDGFVRVCRIADVNEQRHVTIAERDVPALIRALRAYAEARGIALPEESAH